MKSVAEIIRGLRVDMDVDQAVIAERIGMSQQQYSRYETGKSDPNARALKILADFHNTSADYLLGRTNRKEGIVNADEMITSQRTAGEVISDIAMLSPERRRTVVDFISFLMARESAEENEVKDGKL